MKYITTILTILAGIMCAPALSALDGGPYYGTNYTVPFAHAYRALGTLGVDRRQAIDRDVYHMSRLGLNAFRLHLWDVEISDGDGHLLANDHLDLVDYLLARLEERGIRAILTAQTNFGNGYPERNTDPNGAFTYKYEKCHIHDTPEAVAAQERYLKELVAHVNPYTGRSYADDPAIIAIEINNEPCHSGTHEQITAYVDRMAAAMRDAGWRKDILYNVSHNLWRTSAFYRAAIDGTTYQWYPTGLVHGSTRTGNFLPVLDSYDIPFDTVPGYAARPKVVYEFDPADVLDTYLYPAAARTFRKAGFDWATQFAYDPIDMARFNTEYQTHFLNLAYTPGKAIGMAIAAEVMRRTPRGANYGKYPADTVFDAFTVSARRNLAMLNDGEKYYHTNNTTEAPVRPAKLKAIAAVGSSPIVVTDGTGAYFLDRLGKNTWRLEVMPDVIITTDPFAKPSLRREVAVTLDSPVAMTLSLPGLPDGFHYRGERGSGRADGGSISVLPGVYVLGADAAAAASVGPDATYADGTRRVGEYVMPPISRPDRPVLVHRAALSAPAGNALRIAATVAGEPDSVKIYPASADFWRNDNPLVTMAKTGKYEYSATVDPGIIGEKDRFDYRIVVFKGADAVTYPSGDDGTPLDWDFGAGRGAVACFTTAMRPAGASLVLLDATSGTSDIELATIPEAWSAYRLHATPATADSAPALLLEGHDGRQGVETVSISRYVAPAVRALGNDVPSGAIQLRIADADSVEGLRIGLVNADGFTFWAEAKAAPGAVVTIPLSDFRLGETLLNPAPYPSFLGRRFVPADGTDTALNPAEIETAVIAARSAGRLQIKDLQIIN